MDQSEFKRRRKRLMQILSKDSLAIIVAAPAQFRNSDVEYPYRPDSDFFYLTGFNEPEAVAVFFPKQNGGQYFLFCRERNPQMEIWTGRMIGLDDAKAKYGADDAFPIDDIDELMPELMENTRQVYYSLGRQEKFDQRLIKWIAQTKQKSRAGVGAPDDICSLEKPIHEMRLFKSRVELAQMKKAANIAAVAHCKAMQTCHVGDFEYQLQATIEHHFQDTQTTTAYGSIVGGGANACVLHYTENADTLRDGDLVLIDAGCEYQYYASDITRTFPVNGRFSDEQKALYNLVLDAQLAAIDKVKPGNYWNDPHDAAVKVLARGLIKLGLLSGSLKDVLKNQDYRRFYMHRTGHWLGMDVHDVGEYKLSGKWRKFEPGMVLTVEPGLYIPAGSKKVAKKWWDIGIRIEDDVVVTKQACDVLSKQVPKTVDEIERLMATIIAK